ncbi:MAG: hypothetical protein ACFB16_12445 [Phormidesmis sp.]
MTQRVFDVSRTFFRSPERTMASLAAARARGRNGGPPKALDES